MTASSVVVISTFIDASAGLSLSCLNHCRRSRSTSHCTHPPVQQSSDCGVFAIAFAVHAALGDEVMHIEFD